MSASADVLVNLDATGLTAAFNNGSGAWDNNSGANYSLPRGRVTVKDGGRATDAAARRSDRARG